MNLRLKTALIVGTASVTLAVALSLVVSNIWRSEFDQLEHKHTNDQVTALEMNLQAQANQLLAINYDWSTWDTMYAFSGNEKNGLSKNLADPSLSKIHLDLLLVLNSQREVRLTKLRHLDGSYSALEAQELKELLAQLPTSLSANQEQTAWVRLADQVLLLSIRPIQKDNGQGQTRGMLVMGQRLMPTLLTDLNQARFGEIQPLAADALVDPLNVPTAMLTRNIRVLNDNSIAGDLELRDTLGQRIAWLELRTPRPIHAQSLRALNLLHSVLLGGAILFTILVMAALELGLLRRIGKLTQEIRAIPDPSSPQRLNVGQGDEIGSLAKSFNITLERISEMKLLADARQHDLEQISQRYEVFFRDGRDLVILLDREGTVHYASPNIVGILGSKGQALQRHEADIWSLVHEADMPIADHAMEQMFSGDSKALNFEMRILSDEPTERWFEVWASNLEDDAALNGILLNAREVTARKLNEAALLESERRLRLHFERMPLAVLEWNPDLTVSSWNPAAEHLFGYSAQEVIGKVMLQAINTEAVSLDPEEVLKTVLTKSGSRVNNSNRHKDGSSITCEWTNTPITNQDGQIISVISVGRDISEKVRNEHTILESRERYRELVGALNGVVWEVIYGQQIVFMSDRSLELLGYDSKTWLEDPTFWESHVHPDDLEKASNAVRLGVQTGGNFQSDYRFLTADGRYLWMRDVVTVTRMTNGKTRLRGVLLDITEAKSNELKLEQSEARYELAMRGANDGIWDWDIQNKALYLSKRCREILGMPTDESVAVTQEMVDGATHPDDLERYINEFEAHALGKTANLSVEYRVMIGKGLYRWVLLRGVGTPGPKGMIRMAGSITDLTERGAYYDPLTGLPGRRLLVDRLERVVASHRRDPEKSFSLLFTDLDRFKVINDSLGHAVGDALLLEVARRIDRSLRPGDVVARWGGDEFVLLLENTTPKEARKIAMRLRLLIGEPFRLGELETFTGISIGIVNSRSDPSSTDPDGTEETGVAEASAADYLRSADTAMYSAKAMGTGIEEYDLAMHSEALERMDLETALCRAIEHNELRVYYQPIMDVQAGRIKSFEALVRWQHPKRGLVPPGDFIPLAEETGLIVQIGEWVLDESCRQLREWRDAGLVAPDLSINVNIASLQLQRHGFVETVAEILEQHQLEASSINLEITESSVVHGSEHAERTLRELRQIGVGLHLDDFGTGYSSLSYLQRLPITTIKIDRTFIRDIGLETNREIVRVIVSLAQTLKLGLICEGVETTQQLEWLHEMGCSKLQGYLFSKPVPASDAVRLIERNFSGLTDQFLHF
jgi:diguanylate cyclase (GGDEF)-like protein/PAS domain S-box-containing protein